MRYAVVLLLSALFSTSAYSQDFTVQQSTPAPGATSISLSDTVAFAFNSEVNVNTDWNVAFVYEPRDAMRLQRVSLCVNFAGPCGGGDDVSRFVRFHAEHQPNTDYTWLVYAVKSDNGQSMTEPYVLRYTTAPTIGQHRVEGTVSAPVAKRRWSPRLRASIRTLVNGLTRNGLGRPIFEREVPPSSHPAPPSKPGTRPATRFQQRGAKAGSSNGFTQILLLDDFTKAEDEWSVRAADVLIGQAGEYNIDYVREGTYWPITVHYTDGTNTEIDALGFYDPDGDDTPDPLTVEGTSFSSVDLPLFEFPLTTARHANNLTVARDSARQYASDQQLKLIEAGHGMRSAGTAYEWAYRFYSPAQALETLVTIDPLGVTVDTSDAPSFLSSMKRIPPSFINSDAALRIAKNDGGAAFIEPFRPRNLSVLLQGGNLYWTDSPVLSEAFWRVRIVAVTSSRTETFERYIDMETGDVLDESDQPTPPAAPSDLTTEIRDGEVILRWSASPESDVTEYRLYRDTIPLPSELSQIHADTQIATLPGGTETYPDADVSIRQVYYYRLTAVDADGNESIPSAEVSAFPLPSSIAVEATVPFDDASTAQSYRLLALPGREAIALASTFDESAGQGWTAYWDDGRDDGFLVPYDGSSTFDFRPGRGFWVISQSAWTPGRTVEMVTVGENGTYAIDLHDGWNVISNPFDVDVSWDSVQALNGVSQGLWQWDGSFREMGAFASAKRGQAYYFLNEQGLDELTIPYPGAPHTPPSTPPAEPPSKVLTLTAYQDRARVAGIRVGLARDASSGRDAYDQLAPPGYFEAASLRLINSRIGSQHSVLAAEYREAHSKGHTFDLTLTAEPGDPIQLHANGLDAFADQRVILVDPTTAQTYNFQTHPSVVLRPTSETTSLNLLIGTDAFVDAEQETFLPKTVQFRSNYPNPFRDRTTLEYALPEPTDVRLEIYDVLGRRVCTLIDHHQRPGLHRLQWDGRNDARQRVSSGLYISRLKAGRHVRTQRIVLVR